MNSVKYVTKGPSDLKEIGKAAPNERVKQGVDNLDVLLSKTKIDENIRKELHLEARYKTRPNIKIDISSLQPWNIVCHELQSVQGPGVVHRLWNYTVTRVKTLIRPDWGTYHKGIHDTSRLKWKREYSSWNFETRSGWKSCRTVTIVGQVSCIRTLAEKKVTSKNKFTVMPIRAEPPSLDLPDGSMRWCKTRLRAGGLVGTVTVTDISGCLWSG